MIFGFLSCYYDRSINHNAILFIRHEHLFSKALFFGPACSVRNVPHNLTAIGKVNTVKSNFHTFQGSASHTPECWIILVNYRDASVPQISEFCLFWIFFLFYIGIPVISKANVSN